MAWVTLVGRVTVGDCAEVSLPDAAYGSGTVTLSTLVNAGRNANGRFVGQVIGDEAAGYDKMKVEMSWEVLTPAQLQTILQVFDTRQGGAFTNWFRVYDPRTQTYVNKEMYVGDRSGTPIMVSDPGSGDPRYWTGIKVDLIEV